MILSEVAEVLATAAAFDRREIAEIDAEAWLAAFAAARLHDVDVADAKAGVVAHYAQTRQWLMPIDVIDFCKRLRRERLKSVGSVAALVTADPDDQAAYQTEFRQLTAEIAAGRHPAAAQLETGR
jgi:hypothetical protein